MSSGEGAPGAGTTAGTGATTGEATGDLEIVNLQLICGEIGGVALLRSPFQALRRGNDAVNHSRRLDALIPTRIHGVLDYIVGAALIAAPWIFQFNEHTAATAVPIVLGIGLIVYSIFTDYELGLIRVLPMSMHNLFDIGAGALLAASPWIFGFADESANVWAPHLVAGIAAVGLGVLTEQHPRDESTRRGRREPTMR